MDSAVFRSVLTAPHQPPDEVATAVAWVIMLAVMALALYFLTRKD